MRLMQQTCMALVLLGVGCALFVSPEARFLKAAKDRMTQEEVREQWGDPKVVSSSIDGSTMWLYEVRDLEPGSQNTWAMKGSWCEEYVLVFDAGGVLREWAHKAEFHGGETMPLVCVRDGFPRPS